MSRLRHPALETAAHRGRPTPYNAPQDVPLRARRNRIRARRAPRVTEATVQNGAISGQQFDDLLERDNRVLIIESPDPAGTVQQFRAFAGQTGKAIYLWSAEDGFTSLKVVDMKVPGSRRFADALRYVVNSKHYGVYGFLGFERDLKVDSIQLLREIAKSRSGNDRKVILFTSGVRLPEGLQEDCARIEHQPKRRMRLRDGRWIV